MNASTSYTTYLCPYCDKEYSPTFAAKEAAKEFGTLVDIEQHISHICSQKCWDELFTKTTGEDACTKL